LDFRSCWIVFIQVVRGLVNSGGARVFCRLGQTSVLPPLLVRSAAKSHPLPLEVNPLKSSYSGSGERCKRKSNLVHLALVISRSGQTRKVPNCPRSVESLSGLATAHALLCPFPSPLLVKFSNGGAVKIFLSSSLQIINNRSFRYASPYLWNPLPSSFRQPYCVHSPPGSPHPAHITSLQSPPSLSPSITPSTFHSRLKTHLFHKSFPP